MYFSVIIYSLRDQLCPPSGTASFQKSVENMSLEL